VLQKLIAAALLAAAITGIPEANAQQYPARPIRAIATTSAGGISDLFMRALGEELQKRLGQPIIVENRPGGSNNVGTRACIDAAPDGYTICITQTEPVVYNQFLYKNLGFDPEKGLAPISNLFFISQVLFTNAKLGVKTVDELVALSKAKPGTLSYLAPSPALFLYMEWLKESKGADWVRIPFKGGGEAVNAVLNESTPIALLGVGNIIGNIQGGLFTPLAVANELKSPLLPDVPTVVELGYKGAPSRDWFGLFAPAGTPKEIIDRLSVEVQKIIGDPAFRDKHIVSRSLIPAASSPEEFAELIRRDRVTAAQVVKDANLEMR
jgi:tripartite-type tricarboxylate transporter receptor subunit TctC